MTGGRQRRGKKVAGSSSFVPPAIYDSSIDPAIDDDMTLPPSPSLELPGPSVFVSRAPDTTVLETAPEAEIQKIFIRPRTSKQFDKQMLCIQKIGDLIEQRFGGPWRCWSKFPKDTKDLIFSEFQKFFEWDPTNDGAIRSIFYTCAMNSIKNRMYVLRRSGKKPAWLGQSIFDQLNQIWMQDDFKEESERNKKNRASDCDGQGFPSHVRGCVSHAEHIDRLAAKQGHQPSISEAFMHLRSKTDPEGNVHWVNDRAKRTHEQFTTRLTQASSQSSNADEILSTEEQIKIFSEVVGGPKKGVIYGVAGQNYNASGTSSSSSSRHRSLMQWQSERTEMLDLINNMQSSINELHTSFEARLEAAVEQRVEERVEERIEQRVEQRLQEEAKLNQERMSSMEARLLASFASFHHDTSSSARGKSPPPSQQ